MIRKNYLLLTTYVLLLLHSQGCVTIPGKSSYKGSSSAEKSLSVAGLLRFEDVPVPTGFKIIEDESFSFQNDVTRVVLLKYIGSWNIDLVVNFYKDNMPLYNWSPLNIIEYERRILNYEKRQESCIVTVESLGRKSVVIIAISPKSKPMKVKGQ